MQGGVRSEGRRLCITVRSRLAYGERLQQLSVSSFVFLPSSIEWMQRQCHLAEDSGLADSQPLAGAGAWSCCYVLLLSEGFASFLSLENTYRNCRVPEARGPTLKLSGTERAAGSPGVEGSEMIEHKVEPRVSGRRSQSQSIPGTPTFYLTVAEDSTQFPSLSPFLPHPSCLLLSLSLC